MSVVNNLAQKRLRYQGRFISLKEADKLNQSLIYNPSTHLVSKPIFHTFKDTTRWHRRCGINKLMKNSMGTSESRSKLSTNIFPKPQDELDDIANQQSDDNNDNMDVDAFTF
jgi:hypothetical protein